MTPNGLVVSVSGRAFSLNGSACNTYKITLSSSLDSQAQIRSTFLGGLKCFWSGLALRVVPMVPVKNKTV